MSIHVYVCIYIYIYMYTYMNGQFSKARSEKTGPDPGGFRAFKGHFEVSISNGSGIRDPQFGILRIEIVRTDLYFFHRHRGMLC